MVSICLVNLEVENKNKNLNQNTMLDSSLQRNTVEKYLEEIAERLAAGHATVMVGAGFSKNASDEFPDWETLRLAFYKRLNDEKLKIDSTCMKLASLIDASFGRNELEMIIRDCIPDQKYNPSNVHLKLLKLAWVDVFTTNYDTLLERANNQIPLINYEKINSYEKILKSKSPRIIKLHGCINSKSKLIITEEDYNSYSENFPFFENTIRQSLLENIICLIGFSGDDPNFTRWKDWLVYNNRDDSISSIFLIGVDKLTESEIKLLEKRKIRIVNLFEKYGTDQKNAITLFLEDLEKEVFKNDQINQQVDWPEEVAHTIHVKKSKSENEVNKWKLQRKAYPKWIITPSRNREKLKVQTKTWINNTSQVIQMDFPSNINFLYELDWRIEKCLYTIWNENIQYYEKIIDQINPFPDLITSNSICSPLENDGYEWNDIKFKWIELHFSMLRLYREEEFQEKWEKTNRNIVLIKSELSSEQTARWFYEQTLKCFFLLEFEEAKTKIENWPINNDLPLWEAKRAALVSELGEPIKALKIVSLSLESIRAKKNQDSFVQMDIILEIYWHIFQKTQFDRHELIKSKNEIKREREELKKPSVILAELEKFRMKLQKNYSHPSRISSIYSYDIGRTSRQIQYGSNDEIIDAYAYLHFCEEIGLVNLDINATTEVINRIGHFSIYWAIISIIRSGEVKLVDSIFDRESISRFNSEQLENVLEQFLKLLYDTLSNLPEDKSLLNRGIYVRVAAVIPEIISRICLKCSTSHRNKIIDFLIILYKSSQKDRFKKIANLLGRTINSYSKRDIYQLLPRLFEFPILPDSYLVDSEYIDPFLVFNFDKSEFSRKISINQVDIEALFEKINSNDLNEQKCAYIRLGFLFYLKLLSRKQIHLFAKKLWSDIDITTGLPRQSAFRDSHILKLPYLGSINPSTILKGYILKTPLLIQKDQEKEKGIGFYDRNDLPVLPQIYYGSKSIIRNTGIEWSEQELIELFVRLFNWWKVDKEYLKLTEIYFLESVSEQFQKRFSYLVSILSEIILPQIKIKLDNDIKGKIKTLLVEMDEYSLPCLKACVASMIIFPNRIKLVEQKILDKCMSGDELQINNAFVSIHFWFLLNKHNLVNKIPEKIITLPTHCINWKSFVGIVSALEVLGSIINDFPESINYKQIKNILFSLKFLISTENISNNDFSIKIEKSLEIKQYSARLAFSLYKYHIKYILAVPQILNDWKAICEDPNEFVEIRNQWE